MIHMWACPIFCAAKHITGQAVVVDIVPNTTPILLTDRGLTLQSLEACGISLSHRRRAFAVEFFQARGITLTPERELTIVVTHGIGNAAERLALGCADYIRRALPRARIDARIMALATFLRVSASS